LISTQSPRNHRENYDGLRSRTHGAERSPQLPRKATHLH
jgi:hypothetical protein